MQRLADKAAMKILAVSRAIRKGTPAPVEPETVKPAPVPAPAPLGPVAPAGGVPPLDAAPVDTGIVLQGGDMFDALAGGAT